MINEARVEQAALDRLNALGYEVLSGLAIAPGEHAAERSDTKQGFSWTGTNIEKHRARTGFACPQKRDN